MIIKLKHSYKFLKISRKNTSRQRDFNPRPSNYRSFKICFKFRIQVVIMNLSMVSGWIPQKWLFKIIQIIIIIFLKNNITIWVMNDIETFYGSSLKSWSIRVKSKKCMYFITGNSVNWLINYLSFSNESTMTAYYYKLVNIYKFILLK